MAAKMLMRRAQDEATRHRADIAGEVSGIRTALRGYAKTTQGESLAQDYDEIRALARQHRASAKARRTRAEAAAKGAKTRK
jgi:hypothetical protein